MSDPVKRRMSTPRRGPLKQSAKARKTNSKKDIMNAEEDLRKAYAAILAPGHQDSERAKAALSHFIRSMTDGAKFVVKIKDTNVNKAELEQKLVEAAQDNDLDNFKKKLKSYEDKAKKIRADIERLERGDVSVSATDEIRDEIQPWTAKMFNYELEVESKKASENPMLTRLRTLRDKMPSRNGEDGSCVIKL